MIANLGQIGSESDMMKNGRNFSGYQLYGSNLAMQYVPEYVQNWYIESMDNVTERISILLRYKRYAQPETLQSWLRGTLTDEELIAINEVQNANCGKRSLAENDRDRSGSGGKSPVYIDSASGGGVF